MDFFLQHIARSLYREFGDDLAHHCLVFPGRRSSLFFIKYLSGELSRPLFAPETMTINELFRELSALRPVENEMLLFELYKVYRKVRNINESFDEFYYWGDILLNDFDDVDKYLADASKVFSSVSDLKNIDEQFGGLTEEQIGIVQRFWTNFNPARRTEVKEKFLSIWELLEQLYTAFTNVLREKQIGYEGMIFRDVAGNDTIQDHPALRWKMVHFIGFNALNECEKKIMLDLKKAGKARFYWDYDNSYITGNGLNSAGHFLKADLKLFGNDMPEGWNYNSYLSSPAVNVTRKVIEASSDVAQVKLVPQLVAALPGLSADNAHNTAVVLADENLLIPMLTSLPDDVQDINITMGYPLRHTSVYQLIRHLLDLQKRSTVEGENALFNYSDVSAVLNNILVSARMDDTDRHLQAGIISHNMIRIPGAYFSPSGFLSEIFVRAGTPEQLSVYIRRILLRLGDGGGDDPQEDKIPDKLVREFIYKIILSVNRLETVTASADVQLSAITWMRLLDRILRMQSIPFTGEPLSGIQIMGILETRTLDFKNLIMLSVNEEIMPAGTTSSSFIPFSLRQAFGLPSLNHQESIYAYHFYRLLHRAENVTFIYNSNAEGLRSGEMSRFLQQMKYEPGSSLRFTSLDFEIKNPPATIPEVAKSEEHIRLLYERFTKQSESLLSPSAINTWLFCRMKFYYQYVCGLKEPAKVVDEIDPAILGSALHSSVRTLYSGLVGKTCGKDTLKKIFDDQEATDRVIEVSLDEALQRESGTCMAINEMMAKEVLRNFVRRTIRADIECAPFTIACMERKYTFTIKIDDGPEIRLGGKIDRVDFHEGLYRIVDYKTGNVAETVSSLSDLFTDDRNKEADAWLQTLIYCEAFMSQPGVDRVVPVVYKIKSAGIPHIAAKMVTGKQAVEDYSEIRSTFIELLRDLAGTIFSAGEPFRMTANGSRKCSWCPYNVLCRRHINHSV